KIVRQGTLEEIGSGLAVESEIRIRASHPLNSDALQTLSGVTSVSGENGSASLRAHNPAQAISALVRYLDSQNNQLMDVAIWRPTLEDVFLKITGERLAGEEE